MEDDPRRLLKAFNAHQARQKVPKAPESTSSPESQPPPELAAAARTVLGEAALHSIPAEATIGPDTEPTEPAEDDAWKDEKVPGTNRTYREFENGGAHAMRTTVENGTVVGHVQGDVTLPSGTVFGVDTSRRR